MINLDVSIVIVTHNTLILTRNCIDSIVKKTDKVKYEIILVDNASTDGSKEYFSNRNDITYIYSEENLGFGRANNLAVQHSNAEFIFFLNSDTILLNNVLYSFLIKYKQLVNKSLKPGVLGCLMVGEDLKITSSYGSFEQPLSELRSIVKHMLRMEDLEERFNRKAGDFEVDWIVGADMFVSRELFLKCGMFDQIFFMYHEEVDLQKRIVESGKSNYIVDGPRLIHLEGGSSIVKITNRKRKMVDKSRFLYYKKHTSRSYYYIYRTCYFLLRFPSLFNPKYTLRENLNYIINLLK